MNNIKQINEFLNSLAEQSNIENGMILLDLESYELIGAANSECINSSDSCTTTNRGCSNSTKFCRDGDNSKCENFENTNCPITGLNLTCITNMTISC